MVMEASMSDVVDIILCGVFPALVGVWSFWWSVKRKEFSVVPMGAFCLIIGLLNTMLFLGSKGNQ